MATFKINAGVNLETTTPREVSSMLDGQQQSWFAEMARGVKHFRAAFSGDVIAGALAISDPDQGPRQGFVWAIQRLSVDGLAAADTVKVYRHPAGPNTFVDILTGARPSYRPGSKGFILHGGELLDFVGTGLATTAGNLTVTGELLECPEYMIWKLL